MGIWSNVAGMIINDTNPLWIREETQELETFSAEVGIPLPYHVPL